MKYQTYILLLEVKDLDFFCGEKRSNNSLIMIKLMMGQRIWKKFIVQNVEVGVKCGTVMTEALMNTWS